MHSVIRLFFITLFLLTNGLLFSQSNTSTSSDGNWFTGSNWTSGVPANDDTASITNSMTIDGDIEVDDGSFTVNGGTAIDPAGGSDYKLTIQGSGIFEVDGDVTFGGDLELKNFGDLIIKGCDTLTIGGGAVLENNSILIIESCAVLIVEGNLEMKNNLVATVNGNLLVKGNLEASNSAVASGSGNIQVEGDAELTNSAALFGGTSDCSDCEYGSGGALPVELLSFDAFALNSSFQVSWETATETNNDYFTVEYSFNGLDFYEIKKVKGAGNSLVKRRYQTTFFMRSSQEVVYLRLKQTDFDGKFEVFDAIAVQASQNEVTKHQMVVANNPGTGDRLRLILPSISVGDYEIVISNSKGQLVYQTKGSIGNNIFQIELNPQLSTRGKGVYFIQFRQNNTVELQPYIVE